MRYVIKSNCQKIITDHRTKKTFWEALDRHLENLLITANALTTIKQLDENVIAMLTNGKLGLLKSKPIDDSTHTTPKQDAMPLVASCRTCHNPINPNDSVLIVDPKARELYKTKHLKETPPEKQLCYKCWLKVFAVVNSKLLDDLKAIYGIPPYDKPYNISRNDPYFWNEIIKKYGKEKVDKAIAYLKEKGLLKGEGE